MALYYYYTPGAAIQGGYKVVHCGAARAIPTLLLLLAVMKPFSKKGS